MPEVDPITQFGEAYDAGSWRKASESAAASAHAFRVRIGLEQDPLEHVPADGNGDDPAFWDQMRQFHGWRIRQERDAARAAQAGQQQAGDNGRGKFGHRSFDELAQIIYGKGGEHE